MSYHYDWLMRQIEAISAVLKYIVSGERKHVAAIETEAPTTGGGNPLYTQLQELVARGQYCKAENLLFEMLDSPSYQVLDAAQRFYEDLNRLPDEALEAHDFSREEILEGLQTVCQQFGIPQ